jgi:anthranilate synthase component 2
MKILIIDNYDSFTFNLYQYVAEVLEKEKIKFKLDVFRNDKIKKEKILKSKYTHYIISPGPGHPDDPAYFGISKEILLNFSENTPTLGICLGMQGMASVFGGKVIRAELPMHGKTSVIDHEDIGIFKNIPQKVEVMRYHSLVVEKSSLPQDLVITATDTVKKEIMGLRHKSRPLEGVQFHPESFATEEGKTLLRNFLIR